MRIKFPLDYLSASQQPQAADQKEVTQLGADYVASYNSDALNHNFSFDPEATSRALARRKEHLWEALMWRLSCLDDDGIEAALSDVHRRVFKENALHEPLASIEVVREWRRIYDLKQFTPPWYGPQSAVAVADAIMESPGTTAWIEARKYENGNWEVKGKIGCGLAAQEDSADPALRIASREDGDLWGVGSHSLLRAGEPGINDRAVIASTILWYFAHLYPNCIPFMPLKPPVSED